MLKNWGCHRIYFVSLAVTAAGKSHSTSKYEHVTTCTINEVSFSDNVIFILCRDIMFCLSVKENNLEEASLQDVDKENFSEDESFSGSKEKYKHVFKKSDDTVSSIDFVSVNSEENNYKKMFLEGAQHRKQREKIGNTTKKKQADGLNKKRTLRDGKLLPWGSIVVLKDDNGSK
jgi:hypothetical protein